MDWNDFAERLAVELMRLPARSFLIVQGPGGLPYTQAMRADDVLDAEAVGSAFLPRPLSGRQERRLAGLGWRPPDDDARRNWWDRAPADDAFTEACGRLAARMVAAFRDVYGVRTPLELVYQAGRTGGGALALPGLGIPVAIPEAERTPGSAAEADLEAALAAARERGDQRRYLELLAGVTLCLPAPGDPSAAGDRYATARFGDGTFVLAFTSPEAMDRSLRGQAVHHRPATLERLARDWPHPDWRLAVNPGLPSAAYLDASALLLLQPAPPAAEPPLPEPPPAEPPPAEPPVAAGPSAAERPVAGNGHVPSARPSAPQPPPSPAAEPEDTATVDDGGAVVMQKVIRPDHVAHYLDGGYDRVAGYVHRLGDVLELDTPAKLVRGLGLVYEGTPFSSADEAVHVIRWPAAKPELFRTPLGGIDEWSMGIIPGGWVIEKAPFPGSGYAPGDGSAIPEFKINSQRLPHGARMYRIHASGRVTLVATFDADLRQWRIRLPQAPAGAPPAGPAAGAGEGR
ncbi:TY-Chap domain-containing protein [Actinomadura kijaniata]|uniref:TY-Chap domain-containing protein n=1 Tax=Actinomadura kijaniata TaxID=46161 RepID=UPI000832B4ED|nr:SseB family protein [Actinomadura kijaniata]